MMHPAVRLLLCLLLFNVVVVPSPTVAQRQDSSASSSNVAVWAANSMEKIFPATQPPPAAAATAAAAAGFIRLEAARAEHQPFQVAVRPSVAIHNASVSVVLNTSRDGITFEVRRVRNVPVAVASNVRNKTGDFPDPLPLPCPPAGGGEVLPSGSTSAFWITAIVSPNAAAGKRQGSVELRAGGSSTVARLNLEVVVWGFSVANLTQVTDSGVNNLDPASWRDGQRKQFPGLSEADVLGAWDTELASHRVNWMTYTQVFPRIGITITEAAVSGALGVENTRYDARQLIVKLDSAAFEEKAIGLRKQGVQRLAFPMPIRRSLDLAGEKHDGSGTLDNRPFHGVSRDWTHCILPNATWNFTSSLAPVPVFDTVATDWLAARPVLSARFVAIFKAVYGGIAKRLDARGLMQTVNTVWIKDEPLYFDEFTLAALIKLTELTASIHPQIKLYQTKLALWPYLPAMNTTQVQRLEELVDFWFAEGAPIAADVPCDSKGFTTTECLAQQPIHRIASLRARGKAVYYVDNSVPLIDQPWHRTRLFPWMVWLTDSGLWRPVSMAANRTINPAAVSRRGLGLMGTLSWYCDNCGAGFKNPWADPEEHRKSGRGLPAGGGPFLFYPPDPNVSINRPCDDDSADYSQSRDILTTSIRWELFRKGLEDVERFYQLQDLLADAAPVLAEGGATTAQAGFQALVNDCQETLSGINALVWDFPAMKRKPFGDGYAPHGWSIGQEDETYSTNTSGVVHTLQTVAQCIESLGLALRSGSSFRAL